MVVKRLDSSNHAVVLKTETETETLKPGSQVTMQWSQPFYKNALGRRVYLEEKNQLHNEMNDLMGKFISLQY